MFSLFDGLAQEDISLWRAGGPLVAMLLVALVVAVLEVWRQRRKQARLNLDAGPDSAHPE